MPRAAAAELNLAVLLSEATNQKILPSRGEVRKLIQANGLSLNGQKATAAETPVAELPLLLDKYLVVKKGKKNYFLVELANPSWSSSRGGRFSCVPSRAGTFPPLP